MNSNQELIPQFGLLLYRLKRHTDKLELLVVCYIHHKSNRKIGRNEQKPISQIRHNIHLHDI